ncbi:MAG: LLM class F420-dependent oxidoreductase [Candidatus Binataceae bacterium]|jgi:probable F420-dependent oxidoreductase
MKIGILAFITAATADAATVARKCEALGFESLFLPEHPVVPVNYATRYPTGDGTLPPAASHFGDPLIQLAFAAAATRTIKLGTGVILVPEHHPIALAKEIATLDHYSGGRFLFGIGAGWMAEETEAMGANFSKRWPITREYVAAMKTLWTEPEPSFSGEFLKFPAVHSYPKPAQKPHPPVHVGAGFGDTFQRALKDTVAMGDGWMPVGVSPEQLDKAVASLKKMCAEAGRDFNQIEISITFPVIEGDPRRAIERYREAGCHRLILASPSLAPAKAEMELESLARTFVRH